MVVERRDGSLWMLLRTSYGIGQSVSTDGGTTWSPVVASCPPEVFSRTDVTACLSADDGKAWSGCLFLEERDATYPDATQAPDGTIYVIYDHGRRKEKEILMATFTEEDLAAGRSISPQGREKVLINRAEGVVPDEENWSLFKGKDDPNEPLVFTGF